MADTTRTPKLVGANYTMPDLVAKVTGKAKYAEDYKAEGMLWTKLLLSQMPHARVTRLDLITALAMPGVKAILTADDLPAPADIVTDLDQTIKANLKGEKALTNEPMYEGDPIEKIAIEFEALPFVVDPLTTLRPGSPNARLEGNYWGQPPAPPKTTRIKRSKRAARWRTGRTARCTSSRASAISAPSR